MRPGLRAERGAQSSTELRALQFIWLRRNERIIDFQKVGGIKDSPAADKRRLTLRPGCATHVPLQVQTRNHLFAGARVWSFCACAGSRTTVERAMGTRQTGERLACTVPRYSA